MKLANFQVNSTEVYGIQNNEGFLFPGRFFQTEEEANNGLLKLARARIVEIKEFYESRRKEKEDGTFGKPGRRSDAHNAELKQCEEIIARLEAEETRKNNIESYLGKLNITEEELAEMLRNRQLS